MAIPPTWLNPHSDPIFGPLWQLFHDVAPGAEWESLSLDKHEKNHCVWVRWKGQAHGIGFAHELAALSKAQFATLLRIYFGEEPGTEKSPRSPEQEQRDAGWPDHRGFLERLARENEEDTDE